MPFHGLIIFARGHPPLDSIKQEKFLGILTVISITIFMTLECYNSIYFQGLFFALSIVYIEQGIQMTI